MGGIGSGRQAGRPCTDTLRPLDVRKIKRAGLLVPGCSFSWQWTCGGQATATIDLEAGSDQVVLTYRSRGRRQDGGEWEDMSYPVRLDWTPCHLGGRRVWWRCPSVGCGRRVAVLYGGRVFACRHCHDLTYRCQRETDDDRAARRAGTLRRRLGWEPGILNGRGWKPKGMHWRTFERLQLEYDARARRALEGLAASLGMSGTRHAPIARQTGF